MNSSTEESWEGEAVEENTLTINGTEGKPQPRINSAKYKCLKWLPFSKLNLKYRKLESESKHEETFWRNKFTILSALAYSLVGFVWTMFDESFPLLALAPTVVGGLDAGSREIGIIGAMNGVIVVFVQLGLYRPVVNRIGFLNSFRLGCVAGMISFSLYPTLNHWLYNRAVFWMVVTAITTGKVLSGQFVFTSIAPIIGNSVPVKYVGVVNGMAQSLVALLRAFAPTIAGTLLAWGFSNSLGFPLNQYLVFLLMSLFIAVAFCISLSLPQSLNTPYNH